MTRIRCRERHCTFNRSGICTSVEIEYEPDAGCLTMETREDAEDDEEFEDEELEDLDEDLEDEEEDDDSEDWDEDEEYVGKKTKRR